MENEVIKQYTNGELTVIWKPSACIHSKNCWNAVTGMPQVFDPRKRPWITMDTGPSSKEIAEQVSKCPSGALSTFYNKEKEAAPDAAQAAANQATTDAMQINRIGAEGMIADTPSADGSHPNQAAVSGIVSDIPASPAVNAAKIRIRVLPNGPLVVQGYCEVEDASGNSVTRTDTTAFCRCGFSANKPYCDGSHNSKGFVG